VDKKICFFCKLFQVSNKKSKKFITGKLPPLGSEHFQLTSFCSANPDVFTLTIAGLTGKLQAITPGKKFQLFCR